MSVPVPEFHTCKVRLDALFPCAQELVRDVVEHDITGAVGMVARTSGESALSFPKVS